MNLQNMISQYQVVFILVIIIIINTIQVNE